MCIHEQGVCAKALQALIGVHERETMSVLINVEEAIRGDQNAFAMAAVYQQCRFLS